MYYIKEHNEDQLNPQQNAALACAIKGNPIRESASNGGLQPSKCKSQLIGILFCHMNAIQLTTTKVTSQASNLTIGSGTKLGLQLLKSKLLIGNNNCKEASVVCSHLGYSPFGIKRQSKCINGVVTFLVFRFNSNCEVISKL